MTGLGDDAFTVVVDATVDDKPYQPVLRIGNKAEDKAQTYAKSSLSDQVFLISEYTANRLKAKLEDFIKKDEKKPEEKKKEVKK